MRALIFALLLASPALAAGDAPVPTAEEILQKIDDNLVSDTRTTTITMTVESDRRTRQYTMRTMGRGETEAAVEYLDPARDKGTKMLKKANEMWMYMPSAERVQKISGHMLRQGMMGSDLSYEDMMDSAELEDMYKAQVTGSDTFDGRDCWKLELDAIDDSVTYPKRVSWIDKELYIPLKQELYAISGMKLKTWMMTDIRTYENGRNYPSKMTVVDHLKRGSRTILDITDVKFGVDLEDEVFTLRWLERR